MMSPSDHERDEHLDPNSIGLGGLAAPIRMDRDVGGDDRTWLEEIIAQLEDDSGECWLAMESLAAIDPEMRRAIIGELSGHRSKPGVQSLLRILTAARDPDTRSAARLAYPEAAQPSPGEGDPLQAIRGSSRISGEEFSTTLLQSSSSGLEVCTRREAMQLATPGIDIVNGLVTPIDGMGRGTVMVSIRQAGQRRTAAFWCDVRKGILDVEGEVEPDSPSASRLIEDWMDQTGGDCARDVPGLAVILLKGSLLLSGIEVPGHVRDWAEGMLGPDSDPSEIPGFIPIPAFESIRDEETARRADEILDACPSWLDTSTLTTGLAEEISLREGSSTPDPVRDAGAYRFLFEHLIIHRLEMYRRMLLWMGWVWRGSLREELSRSAFSLAGQLSDEQYEVPSHPFTVALTTRSLRAAQARIQPEGGAGRTLMVRRPL